MKASRRRWAAGWLLAASLLFFPGRAAACAGCRNPSLAISRGSEGPLRVGGLRLGASLTGTSVHVVHEAGCADVTGCTEVPAQPLYLHDQHLYPVELRISGEYAFDRTFGLELQLPFRAITSRVRYTTPAGVEYEPLDRGVHHRDETVVGISDAWLLLRAGGLVGGWWLAARPGLSLPLGRTEADPFALGDRGLQHQHVQLGSGTFDPLLVLETSRRLDKLEISLFAQGQTTLHANGYGYRAPSKVGAGGSLARELFGKFAGSLGLEGLHEAAESWSGRARQDGNLGRTELLGALSVRHSLGENTFSGGLRFPLWRRIVVGDEPAGSLSSPVIVSLGFSRVFGGAVEGD